MPAGDVASGVETSTGLGPVSTEGTVPGATHFSLWWKHACVFLSVKKTNIDMNLSGEKCNQYFLPTYHLQLTLLPCIVTRGQTSKWKQTRLIF